MLRQHKTPWLGKEPNQYAWYIYWRDPVLRRCRRFSTGTRDHAKAEYALGEFLVKHSLDISCEEIRPPESFLLATALQQYIQERGNDLATIELAKRCAHSLIKFFGPCAKVSHLTPQALERYARERIRRPRVIRKKGGNIFVEDKRPVTKGTVRRELSVLSSALTHAVKYRRLTSAPHIYKPPGGETRMRFLNKTEIHALLSNCIASHVRLFVVLAINTGARSGALLELKWNQVDLESRILYLNPDGRAQTTKFRSVIPINDLLYEILAATKKEQEALVLKKREKTEEDIPFYDHVIVYNGKPVKSLRAAFQRSCKRAGLKDVTPHTLRHTAGTLMALAGVDFYLISRVLGHSVQTTTELYAHFAPDHLRRAVKVLEEAMPQTIQ